MTTGSAWLRPGPVPAGDRPPVLVCLPYSGVGASVYRDWPALLHDVAQVCPVQLPGREERAAEDPVRGIDALLTALIPALRPWRDRPLYLFGHCLGGLLAAELALALAAGDGPPPAALLLSGVAPPWLTAAEHTDLSQVSDVELIRELRRRDALPARLVAEPALLALTMPAVRADLALHDSVAVRSRPATPPLSCPLELYAGRNDPSATGRAMTGWDALTSGTARLREFPGDHYFFDTAAAAVAAAVAEHLTGTHR